MSRVNQAPLGHQGSAGVAPWQCTTLRARALAAVIALASLSIAPLTVLGAQDTTSIRSTTGGILVDFQNADIRLVITALAEAAGLNVLYSDLPPRTITLRLRQPIARADVLPLLRSVAQSYGLRIVEEAGLIKVEAAAPGASGRTAAGVGASDSLPEIQLWVYRLRHARAARLASTLQSLFGGRGGTEQAAGAARAPLSERLRDQRIAPVNADTLTRRPPSTPAAPAPTSASAGANIPGRLRSEVQIVPEEFTNSLLVRAIPEDWAIVRSAIEAIDVRPLQVAIEVLIAEVRRTDDIEVGVSATGTQKPRDGTSPTLSGTLQGPTTGDLVLRYLRTGRIEVDAAISLLATRGNVRILSRPLLLAQNGQEARILVGSERPFVQVFRSLPTDAAVRDQVVQYRDVGTSLTVLPTINVDGYVDLEVSQEVSTATAETQFGAPVISTREASTHLFVRSGQATVIGGLIDHQQDRSRSGIPFLMNIPLLGGLFGTTRVTNTNSELFIFLTPHVVDSDTELERIRREIEQNAKLLDEGVRKSKPLIPPVPPDSAHRPR